MKLKFHPNVRKVCHSFATFAAAAALLGSATVSTSALAEVNYAGKRIAVIVPFSEGGGTDSYSRLMAPYFEKHLPGNPKIIVVIAATVATMATVVVTMTAATTVTSGSTRASTRSTAWYAAMCTTTTRPINRRPCTTRHRHPSASA